MKEPLKLVMTVVLTDAENKEKWNLSNTYKDLAYEDVVILQGAVTNALTKAGYDKGNVGPAQGDKPTKPTA